MSRRPRLALTAGDPAGIGPEILLKALSAPDKPEADWVVYGPLAAFEDRARRFGLRSPSDLPVEIADAGGGEVAPGRVSAEGGRTAAAAVLAAAKDALAGRVDGVVTAPLHKESLRAAGYPWPGHTEMLAEAAGVTDVAMMFVGGGLRTALLTIHRSLRSVPDAITGAEVGRVVRLVHRVRHRRRRHRGPGEPPRGDEARGRPRARPRALIPPSPSGSFRPC